jgi:hypothetical protein
MLDEIVAQSASSSVVVDEVTGKENVFNYYTFNSGHSNHQTPLKAVTATHEVAAHVPGAPFKVRRRKSVQDDNQRIGRMVKKLFS